MPQLVSVGGNTEYKLLVKNSLGLIGQRGVAQVGHVKVKDLIFTNYVEVPRVLAVKPKQPHKHLNLNTPGRPL